MYAALMFSVNQSIPCSLLWLLLLCGPPCVRPSQVCRPGLMSNHWAEQANHQSIKHMKRRGRQPLHWPALPTSPTNNNPPSHLFQTAMSRAKYKQITLFICPFYLGDRSPVNYILEPAWRQFKCSGHPFLCLLGDDTTDLARENWRRLSCSTILCGRHRIPYSIFLLRSAAAGWEH